MVPVAEQGASSRTASNGPACHCVDVGGDGFRGQMQPGQVLSQPFEAGRRAVDRDDPGAGSGELGGLAARGGAEIGDGRGRARRRGVSPAAPRRRPGPTRRHRHSPEAARPVHAPVPAPSRWGGCVRRACSPIARGRSPRSDRAPARGRWRRRSCAPSPPHNARPSAPSANPGCPARSRRGRRVLCAPSRAMPRSTALTRPA